MNNFITINVMDLRCLELFGDLSSTVRNDTNKFAIESRGGKIYLYQFFDGSQAIVTFNELQPVKDMKLIFQTSGFVNKLKLFKTGFVIFYEDLTVRFGEKSKWSFEETGLNVLGDMDLIHHDSSRLKSTVFEITNLDKLRYLRYSVGKNQYESVWVKDNYFISADGMSLTSMIKWRDVSSPVDLMFKSHILQIVRYFDLKTVTFNKCIDHEVVWFDYVYSPRASFKCYIQSEENRCIPNLLEAQHMERYNHSSSFTMLGETFVSIVKSLDATTLGTLGNRVFFEITENQLIIKCSDSFNLRSTTVQSRKIVRAAVEERIDIYNVSPELVGFKFCLSNSSALLASRLITEKPFRGRELTFRVKPDIVSSAISITESTGVQTHIVLLYE